MTSEERTTLDATAVQLQGRMDQLARELAGAGPDQVVVLQEQQAVLQQQLGQVVAQRELVTSGVTVVQTPQADTSPVSPTPVRNSALALVLGLVLGVSLAVLLETLRKRSVPVSGSVPVSDDIASTASAPDGARAPAPRPPSPEDPRSAPRNGVGETDKLPDLTDRAALPLPEPGPRPTPAVRASDIGRW